MLNYWTWRTLETIWKSESSGKWFPQFKKGLYIYTHIYWERKLCVHQSLITKRKIAISLDNFLLSRTIYVICLIYKYKLFKKTKLFKSFKNIIYSLFVVTWELTNLYNTKSDKKLYTL